MLTKRQELLSATKQLSAWSRLLWGATIPLQELSSRTIYSVITDTYEEAGFQHKSYDKTERPNVEERAIPLES